MRRYIEEILDSEESARVVIDKIRQLDIYHYIPAEIANFLAEEYYLFRDEVEFARTIDIVERILQKNDPDIRLGWHVKINHLL